MTTTLTPPPAPTAAPAPKGAFTDIALGEPLQRALADKKYTEPSPIQAQAIPHLLAGKDLIGIAQTGTGKTAAFALPILHKLSTDNKPRVGNSPRALVLVPTRELAVQVADSFASYGKHLKLSHTVIFGGVGQFPQVRALSRGVDIVIATPGRLLDLMEQGHVKLNRVEVLVLDEVDRMLDMGFARDMKLITAKLPAQRQSLLFSATLPPAIQEIASNLLQNPVRVEVTPLSTTAERIEQKVCHVSRADKPKLLRHMLKEYSQGLVIVFARTKHGANRLAEDLHKDGIRADAIHGNKSQAARQKALENFRAGRARVLVATDVAARGIDVKGISLVINYDIPDEPESYVHRIGRTARAGAEGIAIAFCDPSERGSFRDVQRLIRQTIPVLAEHPFAITAPVEGQRGEQGGGGAARPRRSFRGQPSGQNRFRGGGSGGGGGGFNRRNDSRSTSSSRPR